MMPDLPPQSSRRFIAASVLGGLAAIVVFAWMLTLGRFDMTEWQRVGDFYDAQAEAWLDGRWDIPQETLGIERFEARGRSYMYQGPWPAILRLPVAAISDGHEGRLTQSSMVLGFAVAVAGASWLHWRVRQVVRGAAPVTRAETVLTAAMTFAVTAGSALLFVASRAWVYHEALIWGVAWTIVALAAVLGAVRRPSVANLALAGAATTLALWSRSSVALGALGAIALLAGVNVLVRIWEAVGARAGTNRGEAVLGWLRRSGSAGQRGALPLVGPAVACLVPLAAYAAVNWIKFRSLFSVPFWTQGFTIVDPQRQAMLEANDGTLFGLGFAPTTLIQYLRPDALSLTRTFPFVDFPSLAEPIGDAHFDLIDRATSIPVSMTLLCVLTVVALVAALRPSTGGSRPDLAPLRVPLAGGLAGALTIIPFGYIANRYLADAVPLLAVGGFAGIQLLLHHLHRRPARSTMLRRRSAIAAVLVLVALGTWINGSLALSYQRLHSPNVKDDVIAGYLDTTYDVAQTLGLDPSIPLLTGDQLPPTAPRGTLFAHGDCDALYLSDGMGVNAVKVTPWNAVERTEAGGRYLRRVTFPEREPGTREPLLSVVADDGRTGVIFTEHRGGAGIAFGYEGEGAGADQISPTRHVPAGRAYTLDLVADPRTSTLHVWLDDRIMLETYFRLDGGTAAVGEDLTGRADIADAFTGSLEPLPERVGLCRELLEEAADG